MTTKFKTIQRKLISLIAAVVVLITSVAPLTETLFSQTNISASADITTIDNNQVYYFSDYQFCEALVDYIDNTIHPDGITLYHYEEYKYNGDYQQYISDLFEDGVFSSIESNSYIIFEIRSGFNYDFNDDGFYFTDILLEIFSSLKLNGCKIMFICGTDEMLFQGYTAFLDYVDIHINTDLFYVFISNIFYQAEQDCGERKIQNCTFVFDESFSEEVEYQKWNSWFLRFYFISYIRTVYMSEIRDGLFATRQVLINNEIKIFCHIEGIYYYDAVNDNIITCLEDEELDFYDDFLQNEHLYVIGSTKNAEYAQDWIGFWTNFRGSIGRDFPIYMYDPVGYEFEEYTIPNVYTSGQLAESHLPLIVFDFLTDQNLSIYDNWWGECVVTHKLILKSPEGWMRYLGDNIFFADGWQIFLSENEYIYFFEDDDYLFDYV